MRRRMLDAAFVLVIGLWVVMGGLLFDDSQPSAVADFCYYSACPARGPCPAVDGPCTCSVTDTYAICAPAPWWSYCWDYNKCLGLDGAGVWCYCRPRAC
jgi:hypothetical protein